MTTATPYPSPQVSSVLAFLRRINAQWLAAPALLVAMALYCELHGLVVGRPAPGLGVSLPWALQMSAGWIMAIAVLHRMWPRMMRSTLAAQRPGWVAAISVLPVAAFTLICELALTARWSDLPAFLYSRMPMHAIVATVLVGLHAWRRSREPAPRTANGTGMPPAVATLEVMTGTGRTEVRVADVESLAAEGNYINVLHQSGRTYLLRQTMAAAEQMLEPHGFVRIHRSLIVNRHRIRERRPGNTLVLESGRSVKIGRAFGRRLNAMERDSG